MRQYIDMVAKLTESILSELDRVTPPINISQEIGSGGKTIYASMNDMLPHRGIRDRNNPQAYSEIFAKSQASHNDGFEREPAPSPKKLKRRRNNDAGVKRLTSVPDKGDASALLHSDFAGTRPKSKPLLALKK